MPIAPELKPLYGHHWRTVCRPRVLARCGGKCERCGHRPRRIEVAHLDGRLALQAEYNRIISMQCEVLALAPRCPWVHRAAWWRIDIRLRSWMGMWDARFKARYRRIR